MSGNAERNLRDILQAAGWSLPVKPSVSFSGCDPVFPSRFRIAEAGSAALAAVGLGAAALWHLRTGRWQAVGVDARAAAAALRSTRYLRIDGAEPPPLWDPVSGIYPDATGRHLYIHCNFANHRAAAVRALGADDDRASVAARIARGDAADLAERIVAASGVGVLVRSPEEWAAHPQSAAVAASPLFSVERIGEAPPRPLPAGDRPLSGIRVLDLTRVLAGPTCARTLAEHGAEVLKIAGPHLPHSGAVELDTGHGKRSAYLDLRQGGDLERLRTLAAEADVFSQSFRPGTLAGRGFSPEALAALRPGIVCVNLSAFGGTGPWGARRGFDTVVQAVSGMATIEGGESGPRFMPVSAIDYVSGYLMAFGAMLALRRRAEEGGSWQVRVSLARIGQWIAERGLLASEAIAGLPADLAAEEIAGLQVESRSPAGRLTHLGPVLHMSETPPRWDRPAVPLGHDRAAWGDQ